MTAHVWKLISNSTSLWVQWLHAYKLKGKSFWDIPYRGNMTWGWRNVLKLRPLIREFIWHKLGDGMTTRVWFDRWCNQSPLTGIISFRDIHREGFNKTTTIHEVVQNGVLVWPAAWLSKYQILTTIANPTLVPDTHDTLEWRDETSVVRRFSVSAIRSRGPKVNWYDVVWYSACIPRHAVHLWLVIRRRLKTQDMLRHWDRVNAVDVTCLLCETTSDTHEHLFFECQFSQQVWQHIKGYAGLARSNEHIDDIIADIHPFATRRTSRSLIAKLMLAAATYFIWQERNCRLFKKTKRTVHQVIECIMNAVRLKVFSCRLKKSPSAYEIVRTWRLSEEILVS